MDKRETDKIEHVHHPAHYGGERNTYEVIKVMLAWHGFDAVITFCLLTAEKYLSRLGKKPGEPFARDLDKARWYTDHASKLQAQMDDACLTYSFTFRHRTSGERFRVTSLGETEAHALKRVREAYPESGWALAGGEADDAVAHWDANASALMLGMREVLCELAYRNRSLVISDSPPLPSAAEHICKTLKLRTIWPRDIAPHVDAKLLTMSGDELKAWAARTLDTIGERIG